MNHSPACHGTPRAVAHAPLRHVYLQATLPSKHLLLASAVALACSFSSAALAENQGAAEQFISTDNASALVVFQGDMIFEPGDAPSQTGDNALSARGFGHDRALARWPNGIIPYAFDPDIDSGERESILQAIAHYHTRTRITFVESQDGDGHDTRLVFRPAGGCASFVGRTDKAEQDLFVEGCSTGSIIHELAHAIGLYHEHTRRDRDNFISVNWDEIASGKEHNFEILTTNAQEFGDYDYGSIMHYGEKFFSRNNQNTINVPDGVVIGQRSALSDLDIATIDGMYATDLDLSIGGRSATVTALDGTSREGLILDVSVTNLGDLGAHSIALDISLGDSAEWLGISEGSGWDCLISGQQLNCSRATHASEANSRFELTVDPGAASMDDLNAQLVSRTLDNDLSNNGYVNGQPATIAEKDAEIAQDSNPDTPTSAPDNSISSNNQAVGNEPDTPNTGSTIDQTPSLGAASESAAGAGGPLLLMLTGMSLWLRRRDLKAAA